MLSLCREVRRVERRWERAVDGEGGEVRVMEEVRREGIVEWRRLGGGGGGAKRRGSKRRVEGC